MYIFSITTVEISPDKADNHTAELIFKTLSPYFGWLINAIAKYTYYKKYVLQS